MENIELKANGPIIRDRRLEFGWSQDQLARAAKVNLRTVQRAEKGAAISVETAADLAAALKLTVPQLREDDVETDGGDVVVLHRQNGPLELINTVGQADQLRITCEAEPTAEIASDLIALVETIEGMDPHPQYPSSYPIGSASGKIRVATDLGAKMTAVSKAGLRIYCGQYHAMGMRLRWDNDEGCWYWKTGQKPEPLLTVVVLVINSDAAKITRKVSDSADSVDGAESLSQEVTQLAEIADPDEFPF